VKKGFLNSLQVVFAVSALIIVAGLLIPGKVYRTEISNIKREQQQYYNAARNQHHSYSLITPEHEFHVSEEFARTVAVNEPIDYSISRLFKEANWYRSTHEGSRSTYSLRIVSGLVIPILTLFAMGLAFRTKLKIETLVFVLQALLLADLIYLIM
jgi:hypothetical protein